MKTCIATLESTTAYSQSRMHDTPKLEKERPDEYELRTWRNKAHTENGEIYIPPMAFKMALETAVRKLQARDGNAREALTECLEYFENKSDADCDQDGFIPNQEMIMASRIKEALGIA